MNCRLDKVKNVMKENFVDCGLYFTRNIVRDPMDTIFKEDGITVDVCNYYEYFEVFGLTDDEKDELKKFYECLQRS